MDSLSQVDQRIFNALKSDLGEAFLLEVLDTFQGDMQHQLCLMQSALDQNDAETFTRAAHSLKSTSLTFGALSFGDLAREVELLGRQGRLEDSREKFHQLQRAGEPLYQVLKDSCHAL